MIFSQFLDPIGKLLGNWSVDLTIWSIILRMVLSLLVGAIIGYERSGKTHSAGFRTNIIVCLGCCISMIVNIYISSISASDLARLAAGVVTGIGFIGAGTILVTSRRQVVGLTTAAALWTCGVLGIAIGIGLYTLSLLGIIMVLVCLAVMPKIENIAKEHSRVYDIHVELLSRTDLKKLVYLIRENNVAIKSITYDPAYASSGLSVYTLTLIATGDKKEFINTTKMCDLLRNLDYVNYVERI